MERATIFLDLANLEQAFRKLGARVDFLGLRNYLVEGRAAGETFVYLPISPYNPERKRHLIDFFRSNGFVVRSKIGKPRPNNRWKCNFDVEMAVDIMHCAHHGRVDIIVMGSGDGDMRPVCDRVRSLGIRCEIAATRASTAKELIEAASGYIDLGPVIQEQQLEMMGGASEDVDRVEPDIDEETH